MSDEASEWEVPHALRERADAEQIDCWTGSRWIPLTDDVWLDVNLSVRYQVRPPASSVPPTPEQIRQIAVVAAQADPTPEPAREWICYPDYIGWLTGGVCTADEPHDHASSLCGYRDGIRTDPATKPEPPSEAVKRLANEWVCTVASDEIEACCADDPHLWADEACTVKTGCGSWGQALHQANRDVARNPSGSDSVDTEQPDETEVADIAADVLGAIAAWLGQYPQGFAPGAVAYDAECPWEMDEVGWDELADYIAHHLARREDH